jgi:UPF0755 protein
MSDVASKLTVKLELDSVSFMQLLDKEGMPEKYGFNKETFRCMFIPDTYEVYWNISGEDLIARMNREYNTFWNSGRKAKAEEIGLSQIETGILASIVQAEISHYDEAPVVAGLYLNRLRKNMFLQADPTLIYAVGDFTIRRVLNIHKQIDSPYNTYKYLGLPPGPINFPSVTSIDAVLNYQQHNYIYMCAREDFSGYHNFATNLQQHNINARRYQQALNREKLFR